MRRRGEGGVQLCRGSTSWEGCTMVEALSLDVIQCRTRTLNRISMLQHIRQIHPGSPLRTITVVRLLGANQRCTMLLYKICLTQRSTLKWRNYQ